eukprot:scaffold297518_cov42-Prasinocladus_malaysianus.AAC.1
MVGTRTARTKGQLTRTASKGALANEETKPATPVKKPAAGSTKPAKDAAQGTKRPLLNSSADCQIRVWWEPTKSKKRTDFAGMYWPATFIRKSGAGKINVKYDNGEVDDVSVENVSPNDLPVDFGGESDRLEVGEFCEVFNNSTSDPAAWFGRVTKANKKSYQVDYPFHDSESESVKLQLPNSLQDTMIRRARVWDENDKAWKLLAPFQEWKDGEVSSPVELTMVTEAELKAKLAGGLSKEIEDKGKELAEENTVLPPAMDLTAPAMDFTVFDNPGPSTSAHAEQAAPQPEPTPGKKKRGRPKAECEMKRETRQKTEAQKAEDALKKQRLAQEAVAEAEAAQAAMPQLASMQSLPAGMTPGVQGLQTMLSNPGMLNLLQSLMAAGATGRPAMPGVPGMPAQPAEAPQPPPQIYIPPLPEDDEDEPDEPVGEPEVSLGPN